MLRAAKFLGSAPTGTIPLASALSRLVLSSAVPRAAASIRAYTDGDDCRRTARTAFVADMMDFMPVDDDALGVNVRCDFDPNGRPRLVLELVSGELSPFQFSRAIQYLAAHPVVGVHASAVDLELKFKSEGGEEESD